MMTGERFVEHCKGWLETTAGRDDISAEEVSAILFVLRHWHRFEPVSVAAVQEARDGKRLSDTVFNYLGTRDPDAAAKWIVEARTELASAREHAS